MTEQECNLTCNFSFSKSNCGEQDRCFIDVNNLIVEKEFASGKL